MSINLNYFCYNPFDHIYIKAAGLQVCSCLSHFSFICLKLDINDYSFSVCVDLEKLCLTASV